MMQPRPGQRAGDKRRRDFGIIGRALESSASAFVRQLAPRHGMRFLDVGCGTGNVSIAAARTGSDVTGVDPREPYLSRGRAWAKNEGLLIRFKPAYLEKLPFSDGNFHIVASFLGLPLMKDPGAAANEMLRVCKRGGRLAITNWDAQGLMGKMLRCAFGYSGDERITQALEFFEPDNLAALVPGANKNGMAQKQAADLQFALTPAETALCFMEFHPPLAEAASTLEPEGRKALAKELTEILEDESEFVRGSTRITTSLHFLEVTKS